MPGASGPRRGPPVTIPPHTLTSEFRLTSGQRTAALHFRQELPSNLRATHFRALTGRGPPTGNERLAEAPGYRRAGEKVRQPTPPPIHHARETSD